MKKERIFIGIDVSKGYADFIILQANKSVVKENFQLDDNKTGHDIFTKLLKELSGGSQIICGVENTGGYERNWVHLIRGLSHQNKDIEVYKFNPKGVKHQIQSELKSTIDDAVSAKGIATYLINNYELFKHNWEKSISERREVTEGKMLNNMINSLKKQKTMKTNQLEKLVYQSFPELLRYFRFSTPTWIYHFLIKYPGAAAVKRSKLSGITSIKYLTQEKAKYLKNLAKNSVASMQSELVEFMIKQQCEDILYIDKEIQVLKKQLEKVFENDERVELITSIKGIAKWSAAAFLVELGDEKRFETASQIVGFFGVNPSFKLSGDGIYKVKMSKQGSANMRSILFTIANNLVLHEEYFKSLYAKYRAKGKKHYVVMGILMSKVLRVLWGMLKTSTKFDSRIDQKNIEKNNQIEQQSQISKKSRRMQELTTDAPISRSNLKKRRATLEPQSSVSDESTRSSKNSSVQI